MPDIEVDFKSFMPKLSTFYIYFKILQEHEFIRSIEVIQNEGKYPSLKVSRQEDFGLL